MFTGIIEQTGTLHQIAVKKDVLQLQVQVTAAFSSGVKNGDSIAINGVCLTAYEVRASAFNVDVSKETQRCTTFGNPINNCRVNLERAVTPSTPLGGHIVSGHIDALGELTTRNDNDNETILWFTVPPGITRYLAVKGSICVDGVSLTINAVSGNQYCVTLIPHTLKNTTLHSLQPGGKVNIEVDLVARYLERLIQHK